MYEKPNVVTLTVDELEEATMSAFLQQQPEQPAEGGGCACQCQCQCQCQGQIT